MAANVKLIRVTLFVALVKGTKLKLVDAKYAGWKVSGLVRRVSTSRRKLTTGLLV